MCNVGAVMHWCTNVDYMPFELFYTYVCSRSVKWIGLDWIWVSI